jgi:hypothetical protein
MTDLALLTLMSQLTQGSAAGHRWRVPSSTCISASALTPCMPCSFRLLPNPRSGADAHDAEPVGVTVADRGIPLVTVAYGTRVARPARTTMLTTWRRRLQLVGRVRPSLVTTASWACAGRARGSWVGMATSVAQRVIQVLR